MASLVSADRLLAKRLELDYNVAVPLSEIIGNAAKKARMTDAEMIRACCDMPGLAEYIASVGNATETQTMATYFEAFEAFLSRVRARSSPFVRAPDDIEKAAECVAEAFIRFAARRDVKRELEDALMDLEKSDEARRNLRSNWGFWPPSTT